MHATSPKTQPMTSEQRRAVLRPCIKRLEQPTAAERADAQMRDGLLARCEEERWIDQQPVIDRVLFWMLIATCVLGGGVVFAQAVVRWL